jgi:small-conductance mechanosensitive channel
MTGEQWLRVVGVLAAAVAAGWLGGWLSHITVGWLGRHSRKRAWLLDRLHRSCHRAWTAVLIVVALNVAVPLAEDAGMPHSVADVAEHALLLALIGAVAWLVVKVLFVAEDAALHWLRVDVPDNRRARRMRTQIGILRRLTAAVVTVIALASMLMTFDTLRTLGTSLLASAGVLGAVAGFAAQATLGNVFAGLQLAVTDAVRLDDAVVIDGEWGWVEELTLTHVVVRLWDQRRLVLPTTYLTQRPFQNWTRYEARVIGSVLLHLDYTAPVEEIRDAAQRIVEESPLWDGRDWVLQVVDTTPTTMVIRVLASAADGPKSWDLRCEIREKLIAFVAEHRPDALPRRELPLLPAAQPVGAGRRPSVGDGDGGGASPSADRRPSSGP